MCAGGALSARSHSFFVPEKRDPFENSFENCVHKKFAQASLRCWICFPQCGIHIAFGGHNPLTRPIKRVQFAFEIHIFALGYLKLFALSDVFSPAVIVKLEAK